MGSVGLLNGKVGLITGAGSGIGRGCAELFAHEGAAGVLVCDTDEPGAQETARRIEAAGGTATAVAADVSRASDVQALVDVVVGAYGRLDFAVNNAGISHRNGPLHELEEDDFDRVIAVNLKGVWLCLKYEIRQMLQNGGGAIVCTASRAALRGAPVAAGYSASKHGVIGLVRSAALGYLEDGIRVNCICPGVVNTPLVRGLDPVRIELLERQQPGGRLAEPAEMAEAAAWLCSERASFVTGVALPVDYGWTAGS